MKTLNGIDSIGSVHLATKYIMFLQSLREEVGIIEDNGKIAEFSIGTYEPFTYGIKIWTAGK